MIAQVISFEELKENIADALEMYLEDVRERYQPDGENATRRRTDFCLSHETGKIH